MSQLCNLFSFSNSLEQECHFLNQQPFKVIKQGDPLYPSKSTPFKIDLQSSRNCSYLIFNQLQLNNNLVQISKWEIPKQTSNYNLHLFQKKNKIKEGGLRNLASFVFKIVQEKHVVTYHEVVQIVLNNIASLQLLEHIKQSNIKRRVYDALNVLSSIGIIKKLKKKRYLFTWQTPSKYKSLLEQKYRQKENLYLELKTVKLKKEKLEEMKKYHFQYFLIKSQAGNKVKVCRNCNQITIKSSIHFQTIQKNN